VTDFEDLEKFCSIKQYTSLVSTRNLSSEDLNLGERIDQFH